MAKVPFSKLNSKADVSIITMPWNEYEIEIQKYLPMAEKANMISRIINLSVTDSGYYNPLKIKVYLTLEILYNYTNITFTAKQKEDVFKLYDSVVGSGLYGQVVSLIPEAEIVDIQKTVQDTVANIYEYKNSVMGILETIGQDYSNATFDLTQLQNILSNSEEFGLLQQIAPMLQDNE